jgi:hypothetical protein
VVTGSAKGCHEPESFTTHSNGWARQWAHDVAGVTDGSRRRMVRGSLIVRFEQFVDTALVRDAMRG